MMACSRASRARVVSGAGAAGPALSSALAAPVSVDVVIVRDIDRPTRNLTDWNAFEKVCVRHSVRLSAYTGGESVLDS